MPVKDTKKRIMVTVEKEVEAKLKVYAEADRRNLSNYLAILIDKHIEEKESNQ